MTPLALRLATAVTQAPSFDEARVVGSIDSPGMDDFVTGLLCAALVLFLPLVAAVVIAFFTARAARQDAREARFLVGEIRREVAILAARVEGVGPPPRRAAESTAAKAESSGVVPGRSEVAPAASPPEAAASARLGAPAAPAAPEVIPRVEASQSVPGAATSGPSSAAPGVAKAEPPAPRLPPVRPQPALPAAEAMNLGAFIERHAVWGFAGVGGILLVIAAMFGLREAILAGWFGPVARFAAGVATGVGAWCVAELLRWRKYDIPAAALSGAGGAILYGTLYAGHARWGIVGQTPTFILMVGITATTMFTAWRRDSRFIAYLSMIGGYATPLLLSTGENKAVAFFAYLALVNAGLLWVSRRREWPDLIAFSGIVTNLLYLGWVVQFRAPDQVLVGLVAPAIFAIGYLILVPTGTTGLAVVATAMGFGTWLLGALAMATPTDLLKADPINALPLPWDLGSTPYLGLAYVLLGAMALPRFAMRWSAGRVGAGLIVGAAAAAYTCSWALAGQSRWDVAIVAGPAVGLLALLAGGPAAGLPALAGAALASLGANLVQEIPAEYLAPHVGALLLGALWAGYGRGQRFALAGAALLLPLFAYPHLNDRLMSGDAATIMLVILPVYFALSVVPFFRPQRGDLGSVLGAGLVPVVAFWPLYQSWNYSFGSGFSGLLPILLGANALLGCVAMLRVARSALDDRESAILILVSLLAIAVAIPVQLDEGWMTVGWAIEVALLAWAWRRVRHPLLVGAGAILAAIVSARLLLNPYALEYGDGSGYPLFNWTLYTWGVPLLSFLVAARWFEASWLRSALRSVAVLLGFALLNLEIAHFFAHDGQLSFRSERLGEEMTRSVAWGGYGLMLIVLGIANRSRATRLFGLVFAVLGAGKVFVVDTWSLSGFARVGAFGGMAVTLLAAAVAFAYLVRTDNQREARPPEAP